MTERRLIAMKPETLEGLNKLAQSARQKTGVSIQPMQIAAAVLEKFARYLSADEVTALLDESA